MKRHLTVLMISITLCGCCSPRGRLALSVRKVNPHPFLIDHDRVLVATVGGKEVDSEPLHPDTGPGSPLHYVRSGGTITVVDANGMWYEVSREGIKRLEWHWLEPLPRGAVRCIALDEDGQYEDAPVRNVDLRSVYRYKDPPD